MASGKRSFPTWAILLIGLCAFFLVVPCIGIIAAVAIPAFVQYQRKSQTTEAVANLTSLSAVVSGHCNEGNGLPGSAGPVPSVPGTDPQVAEFGADPVFAELGFTPSEPLRYSYSIRPGPAGVVLVAEGDLDGDGERSRFEVTCRPQHCECDSTVVRTNELE